ncbi:E3 ubiquitin-protein ligase RNF187 [Fukomys damarensis]|uniref:E3 ubiquitin-protein ligase RNF187 n=1 Tax=Fukomys damarensis TaxID=885580 RepID=A0A091CPR7_FUKDA|nr:E3 ubiquitin-protein ligase RNF187 [Fukomys damarensis]
MPIDSSPIDPRDGPPLTAENKGSVEIMRKDLNDARDLHGQAESAAAVWKASGSVEGGGHWMQCGHVMDRRKKALTDYRKLRAFFEEEEEHFLQEAGKEESTPEDELADPAERFRSLLQAVLELEKKHRSLGLSMLLQVRAIRRSRRFRSPIPSTTPLLPPLLPLSRRQGSRRGRLDHRMQGRSNWWPAMAGDFDYPYILQQAIHLQQLGDC